MSRQEQLSGLDIVSFEQRGSGGSWELVRAEAPSWPGAGLLPGLRWAGSVPVAQRSDTGLPGQGLARPPAGYSPRDPPPYCS